MKKALQFGERTNSGARIANRAYVPIDLKVEACYAQVVTSKNIQPLDFAKDPIGSRNLINNFVSRTTQGLIKDIVPDGMISANTRLVLANAVYFKGTWLMGFSKDLTKKGIFRSVDGNQEANFMSFPKEVKLKFGEIPELESEVRTTTQ